MQTLLLATGETTKLRPLTEAFPSPLLPVAGRPIMAYTLELLARQHTKHILVSLFRSGGQIEASFGSGSRWGLDLEYKLQPRAWGSAGAMWWAGQNLNEAFLVIPADTLVDFDLQPAFAEHTAHQNTVTMICCQTGPDQTPTAEPAAYIFDPMVIKLIPARAYFDITTDLLPAITQAGMKVGVFETGGYWNGLRSFAEYQEAQRLVLQSALEESPSPLRYSLPAGRIKQKGVWVGRNSNIHPQAHLHSPLYVGTNCYIGKDADIGPETVIGDNCIIDEDATVSGTTVLDNTYVGRLLNLERRVVHKQLVIDTDTEECVVLTDEHLLSETYRELQDSHLIGVLDRLAALALFLITVPIQLVIALLLFVSNGKVYTRIPCIHMHANETTATLETKCFNLMHFQTRKTNDEPTKLGEWLERRDLHRIPELMNAIKGDIRIVGVKPFSETENSRVTETWQKTRYQASPGITGLWYVQTTPNSEFDEILVADAYYAATHTLWGDVGLCFNSILTWLRRL